MVEIAQSKQIRSLHAVLLAPHTHLSQRFQVALSGVLLLKIELGGGGSLQINAWECVHPDISCEQNGPKTMFMIIIKSGGLCCKIMFCSLI